MTNSYKKGWRGEKEMRELCKEHGFDVIWNNEDPDRSDITLPEKDFDGEIKYRKSVPKTPYKWLEQDEADFVAMKRVEGRGKPARDWLVTLRLDDFFKLIK